MLNVYEHHVEYSAIDMSRFGIKIAVLTPHSNLDEMRERFINSPDETWFFGKGKKGLYNYLKKHLRDEDRYFNKIFPNIDSEKERWTAFNDDCVVFAVLSSVLYDTPVYLLHPASFKNIVTDDKKHLIKNMTPSLIEGIPIIQ